MRTITIITALTIWVQISNGQVVPSTCTAPDSIISKYVDDADRLSLRRVYRNNLPYVYSVSIPQQYSDTVLNALIAVYNATSLPERDTVTAIYDIHTFPDYALNIFYITADSNLSWMQELQNGNLTTGNPTIDTLIVTYGLTIYSYYISLFTPTHTVSFQTNDNYNVPIITNDLDTITGVLYAEPNSWIGDGNNIWDSVYIDHVELIYSVGWGDCPAGCTARRFWKFNVYFDCSVEFVESYGTPLPITSISDINTTSISVTPNPFNDHLDINGITSNYDYSIYNIMGQKLIHRQSSDNSIRNLDWLPVGQYFLRIKTDKHVITNKLIKK